jgi:hypothetical protein
MIPIEDVKNVFDILDTEIERVQRKVAMQEKSKERIIGKFEYIRRQFHRVCEHCIEAEEKLNGRK